MCIVRLNKNGSLDSSLGSSGKLLTFIGPGNDNVRALAIQLDGKIVVAGYCDSAASGGKKNFCALRDAPAQVSSILRLLAPVVPLQGASTWQ